MYFYIFLFSITLACPNKDERCGSCLADKCHFCYDGYIKSDGTCAESTEKIENCLTYSGDKTCQQCVLGYSLQSNKCEKIILDKCSRIDSNKTCIACDEGILIKDKACDAANKCTIPNCKICMIDNDTEVCVLCSNNSIFPKAKDDYCSTSMDGCLALNFYDQNQCSLCHPNYYHQDGKCTKTSVYTINQKSSMILKIGTIIALLF